MIYICQCYGMIWLNLHRFRFPILTNGAGQDGLPSVTKYWFAIIPPVETRFTELNSGPELLPSPSGCHLLSGLFRIGEEMISPSPELEKRFTLPESRAEIQRHRGIQGQSFPVPNHQDMKGFGMKLCKWNCLKGGYHLPPWPKTLAKKLEPGLTGRGLFFASVQSPEGTRITLSLWI